MKRISIFGTAVLICLTISNGVHGQRLLNKLKDKTEDKFIEEIFKDSEKDTQDKSTENQNTNRDDGIQNTRGTGLENAGPDVIANIDAATEAYSSKKYSDSRYAIRQAMLGVELEMGKKVLKSLPEEVSGLSYKSDYDQVTSTGVGFVGLAIERKYVKSDQELRLTIANNSVLLTSVNMYLSNSAYAANSSDQQYKQIQVQGNRGIIEYDEYSGYKLSVPFGQSSLFMLEGVNFENEQQIMSAAGAFNLDKIKTQLGDK